MAYGAFGWLWPEAIADHAQTPFLALQKALALLTLAEVGLLAVAILLIVQPRRKVRNEEAARIGAVCLAAILIACAFLVLAFVGRPSVYWWNIRYQATSTPMFALCVGLLLSVGARSMGRWERSGFYAALVCGAAVLCFAHATTVLTSMEYLRRIQFRP